MTKEYILVERNEHNTFETAVTEFLSDGWELHGPTQIVTLKNTEEDEYSEEILRYYQAMIKDKE